MQSQTDPGLTPARSAPSQMEPIMSDTNGTTKTRNRRAKMDINTTDRTVTFTLFAPDGTLSAKSFVAHLDKLPKEMQTMLALDRLRNKLMDSYSDPSSDVIAACQSTYDTLLAGNWSATTKGDGADRISDFVVAYAHHHKLDVEVARTKINAAQMSDDADRKAALAEWRKYGPIVAHMNRLSAERAAARASASAAAAKTNKTPAPAAI
jgi:hypothetical protein